MASISCGFKDQVRGSYIHVVIDEQQKMIGWIDQVFPDVFYVKHKEDLFKDNTRYRTIADAMTSFAK